MEVGRLQRVVWYFVVQKITKPAVEPLLSRFGNKKTFSIGEKLYKGKVLVSRWKQVTT
jgi:hypothetical protein